MGLVMTQKKGWKEGVCRQKASKQARGAHLLERAGVLLAMGQHWVVGTALL